MRSLKLIWILVILASFVGPTLSQDPPTPQPPDVVPGVLGEIEIQAPEMLPDRSIADIKVTVPGDKQATLMVLKGKTATATSPTYLDEDVTGIEIRKGAEANLWHLFGSAGKYRIIAFAQLSDGPSVKSIEVQFGPEVPLPPFPPGPGPDPGPMQPGKRVTLIFWETNNPSWTPQQTKNVQNMITSTQVGETKFRQWMKNQGHPTPQWLDDEESDFKVKPFLQVARAKFSDNVPTVVVIDPLRITVDGGVLDVSKLEDVGIDNAALKLQEHLDKWDGPPTPSIN